MCGVGVGMATDAAPASTAPTDYFRTFLLILLSAVVWACRRAVSGRPRAGNAAGNMEDVGTAEGKDSSDSLGGEATGTAGGAHTESKQQHKKKRNMDPNISAELERLNRELDKSAEERQAVFDAAADWMKEAGKPRALGEFIRSDSTKKEVLLCLH